MDRFVNILLTSDKKYVKIIGITMTSVMENLSKNKIARFFIITQDFSSEDINELNKLKNRYKNCEIINIPVAPYLDLFKFADVSKFKNKYISLACYFRLLIFKILPEDVKKCFYIDGDIIVNCDLSQIKIPDNKLIAAVIEAHAMQYKEDILSHVYKMDDFYNFINNSNEFPYFNAGFFLLNIEAARKLNLFEKAMEFLQRYPNPPYADQDTLNAVIGQKYRGLIDYLPPEYNLFADIDYDTNFDKLPYKEEYIKYALTKPKIIHYAGANKPWTTLAVKNFLGLWWKYYKLSPWGNDYLLKLSKLIFNTKRLKKFLISVTWNKKIHRIKILNKEIFSNKFNNFFVSIIVTSYNYEKYIRETLNSILNQTYQNFEVIIIDDGSTDNSLNIIKEYTEKYSNFYLYQHQNGENKGLCKSIELALSKVKGEYCAFLESDDFWSSDYLQNKIDFINKNKKAGLIVNDIITLEGGSCNNYVEQQADFFRKNTNTKILFKAFWKHNAIPTFSEVMVRTNLIKKCNFNPPIPAWLDFWLWRQIALCSPIGYVDKKLTYWRIHNDSFVNKNFNENNKNKRFFIKSSNKLLMKKYPLRYSIELLLKIARKICHI